MRSIRSKLKKIYQVVVPDKLRLIISNFKTYGNELNTLRYLNLRQKLSFFRAYFDNSFGDEIRITGGKTNSDKTFFVIRRKGEKIGLFSMYITTAGWIKYAIEKGYIPVIDMCNYKNNYIETSQIGRINAWEQYFDQPMGYGIEEAYQSKNLILSGLFVLDERPNDSMRFLENQNGEAAQWRKITHSYMKVKGDLWEEVFDEFSLLAEKDGKRAKVLGVSLRGTDYIRLRPKHHPIQPEPEDVVKDIEKAMEEWNCKKIFVATEDKGILELFRTHFGEAFLTNDRSYVDYQGGAICNIEEAHIDNAYLMGKGYLASMIMLTLCDCLIAGRTSGNAGIVAMGDGWEHSFFYDLGVYE